MVSYTNRANDSMFPLQTVKEKLVLGYVSVGQLNPTSQDSPKPQRELQCEFRCTAEIQPSHQGLVGHCEPQSSSTMISGWVSVVSPDQFKTSVPEA